MNQSEQNPKPMARRLNWIKVNREERALEMNRGRQLRQSIDILNDLINQNAHRPESITLLRKILRERAELQVVNRRDETSLSG